jgi:hypothetical protein
MDGPQLATKLIERASSLMPDDSFVAMMLRTDFLGVIEAGSTCSADAGPSTCIRQAQAGVVRRLAHGPGDALQALAQPPFCYRIPQYEATQDGKGDARCSITADLSGALARGGMRCKSFAELQKRAWGRIWPMAAKLLPRAGRNGKAREDAKSLKWTEWIGDNSLFGADQFPVVRYKFPVLTEQGI